MNSELENALIALADVITWKWSDQSGNAGGWHGKTKTAQYQIIPPIAAPGEAEATPATVSWRLVLWLFDKSEDHGAWVSSAEQGKAVCVRHAVTGDLSEADTLAEAMVAQMEQFLSQSKTT